jgi:hypothetical protein
VIRTTTAVLLAAALAAVSLPAVGAGATDRAARLTDAELTAAAGALDRLTAHSRPVRQGTPAGRTIELDLPAGGPLRAFSVGVRVVVADGAFRWHVTGVGTTRSGRVQTATPLVAPEGFALAGGVHRVRLRYVRTGRGPRLLLAGEG